MTLSAEHVPGLDPEKLGTPSSLNVANNGIESALTGKTAETIFVLPEWHKVKRIGWFESAWAFYGIDSLGEEIPTWYMAA